MAGVAIDDPWLGGGVIDVAQYAARCPAPKGEAGFEEVTASLKRCPDTKPKIFGSLCRLLSSNRSDLVCGVWQARDPYSAVAFVPDVETDQQRGELLDNARILKLPAINRSHIRDLRREFHRDLRGIRIIAAHDHVAIDVFVLVAVENVRRNVVECRD